MRKIFVWFIVFGVVSICHAMSPAPLAARIDDSHFNLGIPVVLIGDSASNSPDSYVFDSSDPAKKLWFLRTNLWSVQTAEGAVAMRYSGDGKLVIEGKLKNITGSFGGYPSVIYGRSPWSKTVASDQLVKFPAPIAKMNKLVAFVDYSLNYRQVGGNIAYDLWLTETETPSDPNEGVEVMVWFWKNQTWPAGAFKTASNQSLVVNGLTANKKFNVYVSEKSPSRKWDVVSFIIDDPSAVKSGSVELDLLSFVRAALPLVNKDAPLFLQGIEFGLEFTNKDQEFELAVNRLRIEEE